MRTVPHNHLELFSFNLKTKACRRKIHLTMKLLFKMHNCALIKLSAYIFAMFSVHPMHAAKTYGGLSILDLGRCKPFDLWNSNFVDIGSKLQQANV